MLSESEQEAIRILIGIAEEQDETTYSDEISRAYDVLARCKPIDGLVEAFHKQRDSDAFDRLFERLHALPFGATEPSGRFGYGSVEQDGRRTIVIWNADR